MPNTVAADDQSSREQVLEAIRGVVKAKGGQPSAGLAESLDRGVFFKKFHETLKNNQHEKKSLSERVDEILDLGQRVNFMTTGLHRDRPSPLELAEESYRAF